jgi:signal transduction histidine kinase
MKFINLSAFYFSLINFLKNKFQLSSLYNTENRWAILLGVLVLIPFISVSILGLHNYKIMDSAREIERFERSQIEIEVFQQQFILQLSKLTKALQKTVVETNEDSGFYGIRRLVNHDTLFALIAPFSEDEVNLDNGEQTNSYAEKSILVDTLAERLWAKSYLLEKHVDSIWSPVRSIIGNTYLYCWLQKSDSGFCILLPTEEVYKRLWQSQLLVDANKNIHIQDSFMQTIGINHSGHKYSSSLVNLNGLQLNLSTSLGKEQSELNSELWLILAMTLPLLGLAIAIAWLILINHSKETKMAKKLLYGTQEIAHELRTPLSNINLYIGLILHENSTKDQLAFGDVITNEMQRVTRIIDNATALMRGQQPEQYEYGSPSNLLNELAEQYRLSLAESGCLLTTDCKATGNYFYPKHAAEHVLLNLLNNAKKYAPEQQVTLGLRCDDNILSIWVENNVPNGCTLSSNDTYVKQTSGLGLGLISCDRIVKNLGGSFDCSITKNGRCYTACFPLKDEKPNA